YDAAASEWRGEDNNTRRTGPFIGVNDQNMGSTFQGGIDISQGAARVWMVPKSGKVRITGDTCNTGSARRGAGSSSSRSYAPWVALYNRDTRAGLFIGWDYFGHWASSYVLNAAGGVTAQLRVASYKQTLSHGQSITTPKAFVGLFREDLDNAGNELLDWQY